MGQMRERLADGIVSVAHADELCSDRKLLRFLRGYRGDVSAACDAYSKMLEFRVQNDIDGIRSHLLELEAAAVAQRRHCWIGCSGELPEAAPSTFNRELWPGKSSGSGSSSGSGLAWPGLALPRAAQTQARAHRYDGVIDVTHLPWPYDLPKFQPLQQAIGAGLMHELGVDGEGYPTVVVLKLQAEARVRGRLFPAPQSRSYCLDCYCDLVLHRLSERLSTGLAGRPPSTT